MPERKMTVEEIEAAMDRISAMDKKLSEFSNSKKKKDEEVIKSKKGGFGGLNINARKQMEKVDE